MTERAQRIMKAYEAEDTYNFPKDGVVSAIREIANCFEWDSYGLAQLSADDFIELADELEKL
jgi:hypothetical protein